MSGKGVYSFPGLDKCCRHHLSVSTTFANAKLGWRIQGIVSKCHNAWNVIILSNCKFVFYLEIVKLYVKN